MAWKFGLIALPLAILVAAAPAQSTRQLDAPRVQCKLPGRHYLGSTSQRQKVCLTVSADGKGIRQYAFGARFECGAQTLSGIVFVEGEGFLISVGGVVSFGSAEGTARVAVALRRDGTFRDTFTASQADPSTFRGKLGPASASGSFTVHYVANPTDSFNQVECVATARWSARRTAR